MSDPDAGQSGEAKVVPVLRRVLNFTLAQGGWFAVVTGAAAGRWWIGPVVAVIVVVVHLGLSRGRRGEWILLAVSALAGPLLDGQLKAWGLVGYAADNGAAAWLPPLWIAVLWLLLATMLNESLAWLQGRPALAAVLGAVFGPLSYHAGARLGAVVFPRPALAMATIAAIWAVALPLLLELARRSRQEAR